MATLTMALCLSAIVVQAKPVDRVQRALDREDPQKAWLLCSKDLEKGRINTPVHRETCAHATRIVYIRLYKGAELEKKLHGIHTLWPGTEGARMALEEAAKLAFSLAGSNPTQRAETAERYRDTDVAREEERLEWERLEAEPSLAAVRAYTETWPLFKDREEIETMQMELELAAAETSPDILSWAERWPNSEHLPAGLTRARRLDFLAATSTTERQAFFLRWVGGEEHDTLLATYPESMKQLQGSVCALGAQTLAEILMDDSSNALAEILMDGSSNVPAQRKWELNSLPAVCAEEAMIVVEPHITAALSRSLDLGSRDGLKQADELLAAWFPLFGEEWSDTLVRRLDSINRTLTNEDLQQALDDGYLWRTEHIIESSADLMGEGWVNSSRKRLTSQAQRLATKDLDEALAEGELRQAKQIIEDNADLAGDAWARSSSARVTAQEQKLAKKALDEALADDEISDANKIIEDNADLMGERWVNASNRRVDLVVQEQEHREAQARREAATRRETEQQMSRAIKATAYARCVKHQMRIHGGCILHDCSMIDQICDNAWWDYRNSEFGM